MNNSDKLGGLYPKTATNGHGTSCRYYSNIVENAD